MMTNKPALQASLPQEPFPALARNDDRGIGFEAYLRIILDNFWLIAMIAFAVTLSGAAYAFIAKPVFEANMLFQVEEEGHANEPKNILGEMASTFDVKTSAMSEMELLRSRLVVSRAVDNLKLYIDVHPRYFPVIGVHLAERNTQLSKPGLFGYGGYAWGAEKINISLFNVPDSLQKRDFSITAGDNGQFRLSGKNIEAQGRIGTTLRIATENGGIELRVEQISAAAGAQFVLRSDSRLATIESVQKAMAITEQGKQSGVISVALRGSDPRVISSTLTEIGHEYLRQNRARKTEESEKSLGFLERQLPELKRQLEQSEMKYNSFRERHGTIDLGEEGRLNLQLSAAAKTRRLELQQRRTELLTRFTNEHAIVEGVNIQIREMNDEINSIANHIKQLPMLEQEALSLNRDIKVNTDLYAALLNTSQQLRLITAGKVSNVRLVDMPIIPEKQVRPRSVVIAVAAMIGLILGIIAAMIRKSLNNTIDDPEQIERMFSIPVHAIIPHSAALKKLHESVGDGRRMCPLLANVSPSDQAIESLRSFRSALQFSMSHSINNIVLITGATAALGKTSISANLSAIIAATGKRVLLIDADLRDGNLHQYFGLSRQDGLADFLSGSINLDQIIHRQAIENMDFIGSGTLPPNPSELLLHPYFGEMLELLSSNYDLVVIDSSPILAMADTLITGSHAGSIYITTRAGVTTADEVWESVRRLSQAGLGVKGILFNDLKPQPGRYTYGYGHGKTGNARHSPRTAIGTSRN